MRPVLTPKQLDEEHLHPFSMERQSCKVLGPTKLIFSSESKSSSLSITCSSVAKMKLLPPPRGPASPAVRCVERRSQPLERHSQPWPSGFDSQGTIWHGRSQGFEGCVGRLAVAPRLGKCYATSVLQAACSRCPWPCPRVAAKAQPYLIYLAELQ